MVKHQVHEDFKTFIGNSIPELSKMAADFCTQNHVAAKSLSVLQYGQNLIVSLGFRLDEHPYSISIESVELPIRIIDASSSSTDLDENMFDVMESWSGGDIICHAFYLNDSGKLNVAFLLHE